MVMIGLHIVYKGLLVKQMLYITLWVQYSSGVQKIVKLNNGENSFDLG